MRVERLAEAIAVLKGLFGDGPFSFQGRALHDHRPRWPAEARPAAHPPFLIGGGGRRTLSLAAREADIVGLAPRQLSGQRVEPRSLTSRRPRRRSAGCARPPATASTGLELNVYPSSSGDRRHRRRPGRGRSRVIDHLRARTGIELTASEVLESPHLFIGSVDALVDKFRDLRDRLGISSFMLGEVDELAPVVERLAGT